MNTLRWSLFSLFCLGLFAPLGFLRAGNDLPAAVALDILENVIVTGQSEGFGTAFDYATLKYDVSGNLKWKRRYDGSLSANDQAYAEAVDGAGNVYVTGSSAGFGAALDYATIKMDSSGMVKWVARFNGTGNGDDIARSIAVDSVGNVYVTGSSSSSSGGLDFLTIKYDSTGRRLWSARWSGPNGDDIGRVIKVDASGNVYVTGSSASVFGQDYLTLKYNSSGTLLWTARYNGPGNGNDIPAGLAIDASGNSYVTGSSLGAGSGNDYATVKYDSNGVQKWIARFDGPVSGNDQATAIALDSAGNVLVTGGSYGLGGTVFDYLTIKYNSNGAPIWKERYDGPVSGNDMATALTVDSSGNVYVTGTSLGLNSARDFATIKYNSSGAAQWVMRFNGSGNFDDMAVGIAVSDMSGDVYVTGSSVGALGTGTDYATIKYNAHGAQQWVRTFNGP